jgi:hypothetical protein
VVIVGHGRGWAWASGPLVTAVLVAGCGSGPGATPQGVAATTSIPTTTSTVPRAAPPQLASATGICSAADTLTELSVTRTDAFPQNQVSFEFPAHVTSTNGAAIAGVASAACRLGDFPAGSMSCPADFGIGYALVFTAGSVVFGTITADPTGCPGVTGLGAARWAAPAFWDQLAVALALPAPREYCDPFRGRLPTTATQCGPDL